MSKVMNSRINSEKKNNTLSEEINSFYYGDYKNEFESDEFQEIRSYISLFRAAILQALIDIKSKSKRTELHIAKNNAINWFTEDAYKEDFEQVCQYANLQSKMVKLEFNKFINDKKNNLFNL